MWDPITFHVAEQDIITYKTVYKLENGNFCSIVDSCFMKPLNLDESRIKYTYKLGDDVIIEGFNGNRFDINTKNNGIFSSGTKEFKGLFGEMEGFSLLETIIPKGASYFFSTSPSDKCTSYFSERLIFLKLIARSSNIYSWRAGAIKRKLEYESTATE